jgi:hypothetical protein
MSIILWYRSAPGEARAPPATMMLPITPTDTKVSPDTFV